VLFLSIFIISTIGEIYLILSTAK